MTETQRTRRAGLLLICSLAVLTLLGHFIQGSDANPVFPHTTCDDSPTCGSSPSGSVLPAGAVSPGAVSSGPGSGFDFAAPTGGSVAFRGNLDRTAVLKGGDGLVKMELVLKAEERDREGAVRTPTDFVIVLDRSGSMGGERMEHAHAAVRELISQLAVDDRFGLVSYDSYAEIAIPLSSATPEARGTWRQVVAGITPRGGTNMSSGLDLALGMTGASPGRAARMILISDGHANEGDATVGGLSNRARRFATKEAVVSTIGVGEGFNELLMSAVADAGTGNYYYAAETVQLAQIFSDEFAASRETVATAVAVTIETADGVQVVDAAGYPLEHRGRQTVFRPGSLFSGQERRIWVTLSVPNHALGERSLGRFSLAFKDPEAAQSMRQELSFSQAPKVACVQGEQEYHESFDSDAWARSVAEEDYNSLQEQVAVYVREGRRAEALQEIEAFRTSNSRLNQVMKKQEIRRKLEDLSTLQTEVEDAFQGANQARKQNLLSKSKQSAGRDGRRMGSKKVEPPAGNGRGGA